MINLKDIGRFEELPEIAMHIYKGNIPALQAEIAAGIVLSKYIALSPLDLPISLNWKSCENVRCKISSNGPAL